MPPSAQKCQSASPKRNPKPLRDSPSGPILTASIWKSTHDAQATVSSRNTKVYLQRFLEPGHRRCPRYRRLECLAGGPADFTMSQHVIHIMQLMRIIVFRIHRRPSHLLRRRVSPVSMQFHDAGGKSMQFHDATSDPGGLHLVHLPASPLCVRKKSMG